MEAGALVTAATNRCCCGPGGHVRGRCGGSTPALKECRSGAAGTRSAARAAEAQAVSSTRREEAAAAHSRLTWRSLQHGLLTASTAAVLSHCCHLPAATSEQGLSIVGFCQILTSMQWC